MRSLLNNEGREVDLLHTGLTRLFHQNGLDLTEGILAEGFLAFAAVQFRDGPATPSKSSRLLRTTGMCRCTASMAAPSRAMTSTLTCR